MKLSIFHVRVKNNGAVFNSETYHLVVLASNESEAKLKAVQSGYTLADETYLIDAQIKMDIAVYGNAFIRCNADGTKERIDPTEVRIYRKK